MFDIWFSGHDFWTWISDWEWRNGTQSFLHGCNHRTGDVFSFGQFQNPVKEKVLSDLQYPGQLRLTLRRVQYGQIVFLTVKWLAAVENIPNLVHFYVDDKNRWLSRFIVKVKKRDEGFYPLTQIALTFRKRHSMTVLKNITFW